MSDPQPSSPVPLLKAIAVGFVVVFASYALVYRPDRPVPNIVPGSSSGPAFVVQVIRPRMGLPLGGLVPPELVGLDGHVGFDSTSAGAEVRTSAGRLEFAADEGVLVLVLDGGGNPTADSAIEFELVFEDRPRRVRCRLAEPIVGGLEMAPLPDGEEVSGSFEFELEPCEDAVTGESLGWPSQPLLLRGSFDRLGDPREDEE